MLFDKYFSQTLFGPEIIADFNILKADDYVNVNVFFENNRSIYELAARLDSLNAGFDLRVKEVTKFLKQNLEISKLDFENFILSSSFREDDIRRINFYWISNSANLEIRISALMKIADFQKIKFIEKNSPRYKQLFAEKISDTNTKTVNGAEPGLKTIKADVLWAMGYTGRNVIFLSMDTGVNPSHPALSENFLGNNYPYSRVWYGVRNSEPVDHDASNSHGTHTTGTVLGLDRNNNDTIGVAFNAKWMASDPVAVSNNELLSPVDFMEVFQWVLDPDGNPETTDDVPRVINNSWGYDYSLAIQFGACNLSEAEILVAIETAGICSPFSVGNDGPNASTIGFPAMRAFNIVNPMSVGAVNSLNSIASFSSRGPTPCVEEDGPLKIKPEVVAPGVNIRSASGTDSYAYLQGTSMACPHVTGALLLLAEAFPQASAYDLKSALYFSATDLGESGEDNIYGNGLIDCEAAFNYLSMHYLPVSPVTNAYNVKISIADNITELFCSEDNFFTPKFKVKNTGENEITGFNFKLYLNEELISDSNFNIILAPNQEFVITCNTIQLFPNKNFIHAKIIPFEDVKEFDIFDNAINKKITVLSRVEENYFQNFMNIQNLDETDLIVLNPDLKNVWKLLNWGNENQYQAIGVDFKNYLPRSGQYDYFYLPIIKLPDSDTISFAFTYAYKKRANDIFKDSLFVEISTDCGINFEKLIFSNGGITLATVDGNSYSNYYKPLFSSDFDTINIDLSEFKNNDILIRFVSKNDNGSVLYIDSIGIYSYNSHKILDNLLNNQMPVIYPNPTSELLFIEINQNDDVIIYDLTGKKIKTTKLLQGKNSINILDLDSGIYFVKFKECQITSKIIIKK